MLSAKLVLHSINPDGQPLLTWLLTYPRFFHQDILTHRQFSKNCASSRAIPVNVFIEAVRKEPATPIYWGLNRAGMGACEEVEDKEGAKAWWLEACELALKQAEKGRDLKLAKEIVNRVIEPYQHMTTLLSGTSFDNFYDLRRSQPNGAQPEFMALTDMMIDIHEKSTPVQLNWGEWHIPLVDQDDYDRAHIHVLKRVETLPTFSLEEIEARTKSTILKMATARAARTSYTKHDKICTIDDDIVRFESLKTSKHMSPFEHCAKAVQNEHSSNFVGYRQLRKFVETGETIV